MQLSKQNRIAAVLAVGVVLVVGLYAWTGKKGEEETSIRIGGWKQLRLGESDIYSVFTTPKSPNLVYAVAIGEGGFFAGSRATYKSTDGGASWGRVQRDLELLTVDPTRPQTLYAEDSPGGVYRSTDGGESWLSVGLPEASVVTAIAIDPSASQTLYATVGGGVLKSTNGGDRWRRLRRDREETLAQLAIDPERPRILFLLLREVAKRPAAGAGVLKSTDRGKSWRRTGLWDLVAGAFLYDDPHDIAIEIDPRKRQTLYAIYSSDVYRSTDGGRRWRAIRFRSPIGFLPSAFALDRSRPETVYVTGSDIENQEAFVLKSTTGGETWALVARLKAKSPEYPEASIEFTSLAIDPTGRRVYAGTDGAGIFVCETCWKITSPPSRRS